jgi:4-amino-4-deoxy-L-arabinose transferase-like glycosyltransferase
MHYSHTQSGGPIVYVLGGFVVLELVTAGALRLPALLLLAVVLAVVLALFWSLTVEVDEREIRLRFGIGLIRRHIDRARVVRAHPVRNKWYYGWGIRYTPHGWLWNIGGLAAVELSYTDGTKFRIGTDEPEKLAAAIFGAGTSPG